MTTVQVHKLPTQEPHPEDAYPKTGTGASIFLSNAAKYLQDLAPCYLPNRSGVLEHGTYDDRKASQLLEAKSDLILAETRIVSWFVDLGFDGQCQTEDTNAQL